ncbi:MAG: hypothetical protein K2H03_06260, partial [Muribaculaceae bacterium]|nr:hypothetical protein [Muribaculaceae bacterium]
MKLLPAILLSLTAAPLLIARQGYIGYIAAVINTKSRTVEQRTTYYPYGMPHGDATGAGINRRKFSGKELVTFRGFDAMDYHARWRGLSLPLFDTPDPLQHDYTPLSPYMYCGGDPVNRTDPSGEDIVVLNYGNDIEHQHLALLIQNVDGKWQYYSVNGNNFYLFGEHKGGRTFNDVAIGSWDSPQEFFNSSYNVRDEESKYDKSKNHFGFCEGYQISTTAEQDAIMRDSFTKIANTEYNLLFNNCATAVQQ